VITEELDAWADDFSAFQAGFAHPFGRSEPRTQAGKYLRALLSPIRRKNGWQMAEFMADRSPDATQRLLYQANWDADAARDVLQQFVMEVFGDERGIGIVDETSFLKNGQRSVGVKRQYMGRPARSRTARLARS